VKSTDNAENDGLVRSVLTAYIILALHVVLIAALGLLVLFFRGFVHYMLWIFMGGAALLGFSGYLVYLRMKAEGKTLREVLNTPAFRGRSVEISLLGGLASLKLGNPENGLDALEDMRDEPPPRQLEAPESSRIRELGELARLLEKDLITLEEYQIAKGRLFNTH